MNSIRHIAVWSFGSTLLAVVACASVEHQPPADGSAGMGADTGLGGDTSAGGSSDGGASAGDTAIAGTSQTMGGSSSGASGGGGSSGASAGDTSTGGVAAGSGGTSSGGTAGGAGTAGAGGPLLKNWSFEQGLGGWQVTIVPQTTAKGVFGQGPVGTEILIDGSSQLSYWDGTDTYTGDVRQTVKGLTPGKYQFSVYAAFGTGLVSAYIYATDCSATPQQRFDLPIVDGAASFAQFILKDIDVTGDSCTVGIFASANPGNWLNGDAFVFEPMPAL